MLDAGVDLAVVQKMLGHASPATTAGYDHRDERAKARAASAIHIPWTPSRWLAEQDQAQLDVDELGDATRARMGSQDC